MKAPTYETAAGALAAFLANITGQGAASSGVVRDCYTITLRDATVVRWTNHSSDLVVGGRTFTARTAGGTVPLIRRKSSRCVAGLGEVGALDVTMHCDADTLWGGVPLPLAVLRGAFDGATLLLERAFMAAPGEAVVGAVAVFAGDVEAQASSTTVTLSVESLAARLGRIQVPRGVVQARCLNQLGDAACGVDRGDFSVSTTIGSDSTRTVITTKLLQADGYFDHSVLEFTSGPCDGEKRMVLSYVEGAFELAWPLDGTPGVGNGITVVRECAKTPEECDGVFDNLARFRGFPYVPTGTEAEGI